MRTKCLLAAKRKDYLNSLPDGGKPRNFRQQTV